MKLLYKVSILFFALFLVSCKKDLEEINTNPNAPTDAFPGLILRKVIYDYGEQMSYEGFVAGNLLGQYTTQVDFNLFDRHSLSEPQFGGNPWPFIYANLRDNDIIINKAKSNKNFEVYQGPALILKAYMTAALTDIYGDVPYFNALQGANGNTAPKYDQQEDIYLAENGILDNLSKAIELLTNYEGSQALEGDILFNGDLTAWIRFANSLKIKYLMRISLKQDVSSELQAIFDADNFINDNSQNATFSFTDGQPNNFRMATLREGDFNLYVLSKTMNEILTKYNDNRLATFYRPTATDATNFNGLLNGQNASETSISVADYSLTGNVFRENTSVLEANFMTAWETKLFLAEAAEKGLITANAKSLYDEGVELSFNYWKTEIPATYLTTDSASYGAFGANKIEQIITQKWISNTINGFEGWIEFRRTGFPNLLPVAASLNNDLYPFKMPYPSDEEALNSVNFYQIISNNGNSINQKVWWDAN